MSYSRETLEMAEEHIVQAQGHVIKQERLVSKLKAQGLPTAEAERLLDVFYKTLAQHRAHRDVIAADLDGR